MQSARDGQGLVVPPACWGVDSPTPAIALQRTRLAAQPQRF